MHFNVEDVKMAIEMLKEVKEQKPLFLSEEMCFMSKRKNVSRYVNVESKFYGRKSSMGFNNGPPKPFKDITKRSNSP